MTPRLVPASIALALLVPTLDACTKCRRHTGPEATVEPSPLPPPRTGRSPSPDLAVVIAEEGIVTLDAQGQRVRTLVPDPAVSWCRVDPFSNVLWFRHGETGTLSLLDLESDGPPVTVLEQTPETIVIAYPEQELGQPDTHEFADGIVLHMQETPRVAAAIGCDGDMAYSCFDDEIEDLEAARTQRLAELDQALRAQPLLGIEVLKALVERGRFYRPPAPAHGPEPEVVRTVPREPCEEAPEDCGTATRLPGTRYWLVVVANSRGDFFHETRQLYDPEAAEFFDPQDPKARSRQPLEASGETFVPTWVSPSGELGLAYGSLVELDQGVLASGFSDVCGFWGGGWEVPNR
jgi:hypothetical protein